MYRFLVIGKVGIDSLDTLPVKLLMMQIKTEENNMQFINNLLLDMELDPKLVEYLSITIKILLIGLICIVANYISKKIVISIITRIVTNSKFKWGQIHIGKTRCSESYPIWFLRSLFIRFLQPFQPINQSS